MRLQTSALAIFLLVAPALSLAKSPDWNFAELSLVAISTEEDVPFNHPTGPEFEGAFLVSKTAFVSVSFSSLSDENSGVEYDVNRLSLGIGYRYAITRKTDFYGQVSYENAELKASRDLYMQTFKRSSSDSGFGLAVGLRSRPFKPFETNLGIEYVNISDDGETQVVASGHLFFTDNFAVGLKIEGLDDLNKIGLSLRYVFK
ncbi:outer membrane beta-barrel protein [Paraglaciecola sp. 25GB23A]|uniref:outer membrane beta-barrel protein n=1 Tax=Paraglaciecola sp. 25GB23A TaxID=3156068 RepID=UPI0032AEA19F